MSATLAITNGAVIRDGRRILDGVTFAGAGGEFIGVIGPNGAGKSTLLRAFAGLERLDEGECAVDGQAIAALAPLDRARRLSFLPQARPLYWAMPAEAVVGLGRFAYGAPETLEGEDARAVNAAMRAAGIDHLARRAATTLSGGEAARVHLARALAGETPVLLADEPTAALDPRHQLAIMSVLAGRAETGGLVIAALHDLALAARFCTRIVLLEDGRPAADGPPAEAMTAENLSRAFGATATIAPGPDGAPTVTFSL